MVGSVVLISTICRVWLSFKTRSEDTNTAECSTTAVLDQAARRGSSQTLVTPLPAAVFLVPGFSSLAMLRAMRLNEQALSHPSPHPLSTCFRQQLAAISNVGVRSSTCHQF